jgi:hypothetical protein
MNLTGSAQAEDRAAIIRKAKSAATKYYGETCIDVTLSNERTETVMDGSIGGGIETFTTGYTADWEANVKHIYNQPTYGPAICQGCKEEKWPHR